MLVRPKTGCVRAKIGLTGKLDRRQPGNYLKLSKEIIVMKETYSNESSVISWGSFIDSCLFTTANIINSAKKETTTHNQEQAWMVEFYFGKSFLIEERICIKDIHMLYTLRFWGFSGKIMQPISSNCIAAEVLFVKAPTLFLNEKDKL